MAATASYCAQACALVHIISARLVPFFFRSPTKPAPVARFFCKRPLLVIFVYRRSLGTGFFPGDYYLTAADWSVLGLDSHRNGFK